MTDREQHAARLVYEPIADMRSREIVTAEALVHLEPPAMGETAPEGFYDTAAVGLVGGLGDFVLSEVCAQLAQWHEAGLGTGITVSGSGRDFTDEGLIERVTRHLQAHDASPNLLTLEVLGSEQISDLTQAARVIDGLGAVGVRVLIGDFGTGYSSLAYLKRLPVQTIKIHHSYVTDLPSDLSNGVIVRSTIAMAHSLGLGVLAEGVDDELTCAMLADADCDLIQGVHLAKPMAGSEVIQAVLGGMTLEFTPLGADASDSS